MTALFKHRWNRRAVRIATACFLLGTLLMLASLIETQGLMISFGIFFLALYIPITIVLLIVLLVNTLVHIRDIHEHVMTLIIVLMNIPIAVLYIYFLNP